jgi:hypothetical protein
MIGKRDQFAGLDRLPTGPLCAPLDCGDASK